MLAFKGGSGKINLGRLYVGCRRGNNNESI